MRLEHRRVLLTGGGSGIGLELTSALARTNDVVIAGRDTRKLERAKAGLPALHALRLDVSSESEAHAAVDWMAYHLGGIDLSPPSAEKPNMTYEMTVHQPGHFCELTELLAKTGWAVGCEHFTLRP